MTAMSDMCEVRLAQVESLDLVKIIERVYFTESQTYVIHRGFASMGRQRPVARFIRWIVVETASGQRKKLDLTKDFDYNQAIGKDSTADVLLGVLLLVGLIAGIMYLRRTPY